MSIIDDLITDRTAFDVLNRTDKGHYDYADLNRIGEAINYINQQIIACGADTRATHTAVENWTRSSLPTDAQRQNIVDALDDIRLAVYRPASLPALPGTFKRLTYSGANNIEALLQIKSRIFDDIAASFPYSGYPESGFLWNQIT